MADSITAKPVALLPIRAAYRFRKVSTPLSATNSLVGGADPPLAATINYTVASTPTDSMARDSVRFRVYTDAGALIRRFATAPPKRGLNRALWDLRHEGPRRAKLRTRSAPSASRRDATPTPDRATSAALRACS